MIAELKYVACCLLVDDVSYHRNLKVLLEFSCANIPFGSKNISRIRANQSKRLPHEKVLYISQNPGILFDRKLCKRPHL